MLTMEQRFGDSRYEFRGELSRAGRGITYRAWDRERQVEVALKLIRDLDPVSGVGRFHHDCSVWACVSHSNLAELLDSGELETGAGVQLFTSTPLYQGSSLLELLQRLGRGLRPELISQVVSQAARAMHSLHQQGLVHRNIKLTNVFVQTGGEAKLLDPAVGLGDCIGLSAPAAAMPYLAPEVLRLEGASPLSDIYALGVVFYEALTGARPFSGKTEDEISRAILEKTPEQPFRLVPGLSQGLNAVVMRAIHKDPAMRFPDAAQFAHAVLNTTSSVTQVFRAEPVVVQSPQALKDQKRDQDLDLLRRFLNRAGTPEAEKFTDRIRETARRVASLYPADAEIEQLAEEVLAGLTPKRIATSPATLPPEEPSPVQPVAPPEPEKPQPKQQGKKPAAGKLKYVLIGSVVFGILLGIFALSRSGTDGDAAQLEIRTTPPGARILIAGELRGLSNLILDLPPAEYEVVAELEGYQSAHSMFVLEPGKPFTLDLTLNTLLTAVKVTSEIDGGDPILSGRPLASLAGDEFSLEQVKDGDYELDFESPRGTVRIPLQLAANDVSLVKGLTTSRDLRVVLLSMHGERLRIHASIPGFRASLDDKPMESVSAKGLDLDGLRPGTHQLKLDDGASSRTIPLQITGAPVVHAFVFARQEPDKGALLIVAGVDDAIVTLNGVPFRQRTRRGSLRIAGLKPDEYRVVISRNGYEPAVEQRVSVAPGKEARLEFALKPIARHAVLVIQHDPGTEVYVDGQSAGTIRHEGSVTTQLAAGQHRIELRRGAARSATLTHDFKPGETWQPSPALFALTQPDGVVRFDVAPADARLTVRRQNEPESAAKSIAHGPLALPEGSYTVYATAPKHAGVSVNFAMHPGTTITVPIRLTPIPEAPKVVTHDATAFDEPDGWVRDGHWLVRRGGNYVTYSPANTAGSFSFIIQQRRGKRLQWLLNYRDSKNHALFRLDRRSYSRVAVVNGRNTESAVKDLGFETPESIEIRIDVERTRIVHRLRRSGQWVTLDDWHNPSADFTAGKFGFLIPGGKFFSGADEYAISGFSFTPSSR